MAPANTINAKTQGLVYFDGNKDFNTPPTINENGFIYGIAGTNIESTAAATNGQLLIGVTGDAPVLGTITSDDGTVTVTLGAGTIDLSASPVEISLGAFGSTPNNNGLTLTGTVLNMEPADATHPGGVSTTAQTFAGVKTLSSAPIFSTLTGVLLGNGASALTAASFGTSGYVLTSTGTGASFQAPAAATTPLTAISSATTAAVNNAYIATAACTLTLPTSAANGAVVYATNISGGTFIVAAQGSDQIRMGSTIGAAAGSATSTTDGDSVKLKYYAAGNLWYAEEGPQGIWDVV